MTDYRTLRVALLGAGAVGSQVADLLLKHGDELADRAGAKLELAGIAVRDLDAKRDVDLPRELFTTDADTLIVGSDIVIELMGGIEPAARRCCTRSPRAPTSSRQQGAAGHARLRGLRGRRPGGRRGVLRGRRRRCDPHHPAAARLARR